MENANTIIIFLTCIVTILILGRIIIVPIKSFLKLVINSIFGGILIFLLNCIGISFNFHIGLNIITSMFIRDTRNSWSNFFGNN